MVSTRNGVLTLVMILGSVLLGLAISLNFPPMWFYLPQSQRNAGSCTALGDCTNPDVVRGLMFFLPFSPLLFMRFDDAGWTYNLRGSEKQFSFVLKLIGFMGVSSSGGELLSALAQLNFQFLTAGLLSLLSLPLLGWMMKHSRYVHQREFGSLGATDFVFLGFLYTTLLPLSTIFFLPSIFYVGLTDFSLLLVGSPVFSHFRMKFISMKLLEESRYGL